MTEASLVRRRSGLICDKILRRHQDRLAIVYVRQSTVQQVERHQESTRLQYGLADRAARTRTRGGDEILALVTTNRRPDRQVSGQNTRAEFYLGIVGLNRH